MAFTEDMSVFFDTDGFAEAGTYTPPDEGAAVSVECIVDRNVRVIGEYGQALEPRAEILVQKTQLSAVRRDGVFQFGEERFIVIEPLHDDGVMLQVAAVAVKGSP